jgi:transmembrane sensor
VLVRGERVPDRVKRLGAGDRITIEGERADARGAADEPPPGAPPVNEPPAAQAQAPLGSAPSEPPRKKLPKAPVEAPFLALARRGDYRGAYAALGPEGRKRESERDDVDALLLLADIARLSGHAPEAVAPLSRIVTRHAGDPRAAIAAFTLGRLELDALGQPSRAAQSFQAALDLGLKEPLIEDAQARLVEARARAGDSTGARAAAAAYERRFPQGRRLSDVRRWAQGE